MYDINELYEKIKNADDQGNVILPKEYLKKFIMSSILINKNDISIPKDKIFDYLNNEEFLLPSCFESLDDNKKKKYLSTIENLVRLFYLD